MLLVTVLVGDHDEDVPPSACEKRGMVGKRMTCRQVQVSTAAGLLSAHSYS